MAYHCLATTEPPTTNLSSTSYFVACTLNAATTTTYLSMQDGKPTLTPSLPFLNDLGAWTIWSPGTITNLTKGVSVFIFTLRFIELIYHLVEYCPKCIFNVPSILSGDRIAFWK